jgi:hypothetical protein
MRRTLETAHNLFKNHPDFEKINFIILPELREKMKAVCDIPQDTAKVMEEFKDKFPSLSTEYLATEEGSNDIKSIVPIIYESLERMHSFIFTF